MTNTSDEVEELTRLLQRIPRVARRLQTLRSAGNDQRLPYWCDGEDPASILLTYCAGLVDMIGTAAARVEALESRLDEIDCKAQVAKAAEAHWQMKIALPDGIVFSNLAGEVATLPIGFVRVYRARHRLDATAIVKQGDRIVVKDGEETVVSMPRTLWVVLESVLDATTLPEDIR